MAQVKKLATTDIKGKAYTEVHTRVNSFNEEAIYRDWLFENALSIETSVVHLDAEKGFACIKAELKDKTGRVIRSGHGFEFQGDKSSFVNKTSYLENAETSAVGRALGFLGIGVVDTLASLDEVKIAEHRGKRLDAEESQKSEASKSNVIQHPTSSKPSQVAEMLGDEPEESEAPTQEPELYDKAKAIMSILNRCDSKQALEKAVEDKRPEVGKLPENEKLQLIALKDSLKAKLPDDLMPVF